MNTHSSVPASDIEALTTSLQPLIGLRLSWLSIPVAAVGGYEPSQLAALANTLADGALPQVSLLAVGDQDAERRLDAIGLTKSSGTIGQRESYPDYEHRATGLRVELKGVFVDNPGLNLKRPPTAREPSARLKENVTVDVVEASRDVLLVAALQLGVVDQRCVPQIIDVELFPVISCVIARDERLANSPGRWIQGVPKVLSNAGRKKLLSGHSVTDSDFEKDTNFGKLNRIPYPPLIAFLRKHGNKTPAQRVWQGPQP